MYAGSLAEVFSYAGENPLGFWQPDQVLELKRGGHGYPLLAERLQKYLGRRQGW